MRFVENREAGYGMREFHNLDAGPRGPTLNHLDLRWAAQVRQVGTWHTTGRMRHVTVVFRDGEQRRFRGWQANRILRGVQEHRADLGVH